MHIRETVEVAGLLCMGARNLLEDCPRVSEPALAEYWAASRCRLDEWGRGLRALEDGQDPADEPRNGPSDPRAIPPLAEEVLIGQVLTRTLAALAVAHDRRHGLDEAGPIARNVVAAHGDTVARVQRVLAKRDALLPLQPLKRRIERWTDLLLGYVAPLCGTPSPESPAGHAIEFAFDPSRVQEFAYDAGVHVNSAGDFHRSGTLLTASMRAAFAGGESTALNAGLNQRVAGASLGLFGPEAFDSQGLLRSTTLARLERVTEDTIGMVEQLFNEPDSSGSSLASLLPPPRFT